jgi:hypothetical protein
MLADTGAPAVITITSDDDDVFYCSSRNKTLLTVINLFGLGIRHYGQEVKHM